MPYRIEKNDDDSYRVVNALTGEVHAKHTTKENAEKQVRLMRAYDNGGLRFRKREKLCHGIIC